MENRIDPAKDCVEHLDFSILSIYNSCSIRRSSMKETVTTIEVRQKLGDLLNRVDLRHDQFIIERKGKPLAALVPVEKLDQMDRAARLHILEILERQRGLASLSQAEADQLADEAKHRQRKARRR